MGEVEFKYFSSPDNIVIIILIGTASWDFEFHNTVDEL